MITRPPPSVTRPPPSVTCQPPSVTHHDFLTKKKMLLTKKRPGTPFWLWCSCKHVDTQNAPEFSRKTNPPDGLSLVLEQWDVRHSQCPRGLCVDPALQVRQQDAPVFIAAVPPPWAPVQAHRVPLCPPPPPARWPHGRTQGACARAVDARVQERWPPNSASAAATRAVVRHKGWGYSGQSIMRNDRALDS